LLGHASNACLSEKKENIKRRRKITEERERNGRECAMVFLWISAIFLSPYLGKERISVERKSQSSIMVENRELGKGFLSDANGEREKSKEKTKQKTIANKDLFSCVCLNKGGGDYWGGEIGEAMQMFVLGSRVLPGVPFSRESTGVRSPRSHPFVRTGLVQFSVAQVR